MRGRRDFKVRLGGQYNPLIKDKNPTVFVPLHDLMAVIKATAFAKSGWPVFVNFFTCDVPAVL